MEHAIAFECLLGYLIIKYLLKVMKVHPKTALSKSMWGYSLIVGILTCITLSA